MIFSFPVVTSKLVDQDMLPYLLKTIERNASLQYEDVIERRILQMAQDSIRNNSNNRILSEDDEFDNILIKNADTSTMSSLYNYRKGTIKLNIYTHKKYLSEQQNNNNVTINIQRPRINDVSMTEPYWVIFTVTANGQQVNYTAGFKAVAMETNRAVELFESDIKAGRTFFYKLLNAWSRTLGKRFYYWYIRMFQHFHEERDLEKLRNIIIDEHGNNNELSVIFSIDELNPDRFLEEDIFKLAERTGWTNIWIDDSVNRKFYHWSYNSERGAARRPWQVSNIGYYAAIISYDSLYKTNLGTIPETINQSKDVNSKLFSKKLPLKTINKIIRKELKKKIKNKGKKNE